MKWKNAVRIAAIAIAMFVAQSGFAGGSVYSTVVGVRVDAAGRGMVIFNDSIGGSYAACRHSTYSNALAFDANTPGGKTVLALAMAAKTSGSPINAIGNGTCAVYGGGYVEDWDHGVLY